MPRFVIQRRTALRIVLTLLTTGFVLSAMLPERFQPTVRAAATFAVNSTGDAADSNVSDGLCNDGAGNCTLRAAVQQANATPGTDSITFQIGSGPQTIILGSTLPDITDAVVIDGTTQPGYAGTPLIELQAANNVFPAVSWAFHIASGNSTVRGLAIGPFSVSGILLGGAVNGKGTGGNKIEACYIGLHRDGATSAPTGGACVGLIESPNNVVGGTSAATRNVLSGCGNGVDISGTLATGNIVQGNYIGTNAAGTAAVSNGNGTSGNGIGISLRNEAANNLIGGTSQGAGNVISGNNGDGINMMFGAKANTVQGNYIGLNSAGTARLPNVGNGVHLFTSPSNLIGGTTAEARNVISGNGLSGVAVDGDATGSGNAVQGNFIGTTADGSAPLGNVGGGITVRAPNTLIGGLTSTPGTAPGNFISGQHTNIAVFSPASGTLIQGNLIGTNLAGTAKMFNASFGISCLNTIATIGGTALEARNVISGHATGILLSGSGPSVVQGNYIGTDINGTGIIGNQIAGIVSSIAGASIGGNTATARNVISGNGTGVLIEGGSATVQGNYIGIGADGISALPNTGDGVAFTRSASGSVIGGTSAGAANIIASNGGNGISVTPDVAVVNSFARANPLRGNSIFSNGLLGIDLSASNLFRNPITGLGYDGVTLNDPGDADAGPNDLQNYPVILSAVSSGGNTALQGTLNSKASSTFTLDFYANRSCDASGHGEGQAYLGSTSVTTDASGNATFSASVPAPPATLRVFTATATDASGNTSEFSVCHEEGAPGTVQFTASASVASEQSGTATVTVTRTLGTSGAASVDYATSDGTARAGEDYTSVSGTISFAPGETTKTFTVPLLNDQLNEDTETVNLTLSNPSGVVLGSQSSAVLSITDNDPLPQMSVRGGSVVEGNTGTVEAIFTVSLSAPSGRTVSVSFNTVDEFSPNSAQANVDYQPTGGLLIFNPGETTKTISVLVNGDTTPEPDEFIAVQFDNLTNAVLPQQATSTIADATILDDDSPGIHFSAPAFSVNETAGSVVITVVRRGDTSAAASVNYQTFNLTASNRSDYTTALGKLQFAPNESVKSFRILVNDDAYVEAPEDVLILLTNLSDAPAGTERRATLTINSDDTQPPTAANNPINNSAFFVRQHYHDFLNREPDAPGLAFWTNEIEQCGTDTQCREVKRINVSAAFFLSIEFQGTGYQVVRTFKATFGSGSQARPRGLPSAEELLRDTQELGRGVTVGEGDWRQQLSENQLNYLRRWVESAEFVALFPTTMSGAQFVDLLFTNSAVTPTQAERDAAIAAFGAGGTEGRARALLSVTGSKSVFNRQYNTAFVLMQYVGYLRRSPNEQPDSNFAGFDFWLAKLDSFTLPGEDASNDSVALSRVRRAEMVKSFLTSTEYRARFGTP